jgi:hypothetical protein
MPRSDIAASIWPHLAADRSAPSEQPRSTASPLATSMYPKLVPPKPPKVRLALDKIRNEADWYGAGYESYQAALRWRRR